MFDRSTSYRGSLGKSLGNAPSYNGKCHQITNYWITIYKIRTNERTYEQQCEMKYLKTKKQDIKFLTLKTNSSSCLQLFANFIIYLFFSTLTWPLYDLFMFYFILIYFRFKFSKLNLNQYQKKPKICTAIHSYRSPPKPGYGFKTTTLPPYIRNGYSSVSDNTK